jgi:hypothetical protein
LEAVRLVNRLGILVEGETELDFVEGLLSPHLAAKGVAVWAKCFGGIVRWPRALRDICLHLKEDAGLCVTTFVDYYGLPKSWPGRSSASSLPYSERGAHIAQHLSAAVSAELADDWHSHRFIPFVMIHEFETLVFSDPDACARAWGQPEVVPALNRIRQQFANPEQINDSAATAPSKRLSGIFEELGLGRYDKREYGNLAIHEFGIETIAAVCPQFGVWLRSLECLGAALPGGYLGPS